MHRAGAKPKSFYGTAAYACLEAVQCSKDCDLRLADAYGAGATLFELLTGFEAVAVDREEALLAGGSLQAWEAALLRRVSATELSCRRDAADASVRAHRMCAAWAQRTPQFSFAEASRSPSMALM